jgi:hypothetical protein
MLGYSIIADWKETASFIDAKPLGHGCSGTVFEIDGGLAIKVFANDKEGQMDLSREKEFFDKLLGSSGSVQVMELEQWDSGLELERFDTTLRQRLMDMEDGINDYKFRENTVVRPFPYRLAGRDCLIYESRLRSYDPG